MRRQRQWIVVVLLCCLALAQAVTSAHACSLFKRLSQAPAQAALAMQQMPSDCPAMAKQSGSTLNLCLSHCQLGQQVDVYAGTPVAAIAPQPALTVQPVDQLVAAAAESTSLVAVVAAPPPQLLFSRFLI
jgi:hypothetical protein